MTNENKPKSNRLISIVIPVLNEQENINSTFERLQQLLTTLPNYKFEIIFTDNASTDDSFLCLEALQKKYPTLVRVFRFSKNFGYQASILTGYKKARGDAIVQLDCDLQDPPEMISDFLKLWENGYEVVYGVRTKRDENWLMEKTRKLFYRIANFLSEEPLPLDVGDFRLIDRKIMEALEHFHDAQPYLRGAISQMGFKQIGVKYERHRRERGKSNFSLFSLTSLALDGILNHSIMPLRMASLIGMVVFPLSIITFFGYLIAKLVLAGTIPHGFTTLVLMLIISIGLNSLLLGIIGEYMGRIYKQVKPKPLTIISHQCDKYDKKESNIISP